MPKYTILCSANSNIIFVVLLICVRTLKWPPFRRPIYLLYTAEASYWEILSSLGQYLPAPVLEEPLTLRIQINNNNKLFISLHNITWL